MKPLLVALTIVLVFGIGIVVGAKMTDSPQTCARVNYGIVCWHGLQGQEWSQH